MVHFATNTHTMQRIPLYAGGGGIQRGPWFPFWFPFWFPCMQEEEGFKGNLGSLLGSFLGSLACRKRRDSKGTLVPFLYGRHNSFGSLGPFVSCDGIMYVCFGIRRGPSSVPTQQRRSSRYIAARRRKTRYCR